MSRMKKNTLKINIERPVEEVFAFTTDSSKISQWFDSIVEEISSDIPMKSGTILKNRAPGSDEWKSYRVTDYVPNKTFTLSQVNGDYYVRYIYMPSIDGTDLAYEEWTDNGELASIELQSTLENLKSILGNETSERSDV